MAKIGGCDGRTPEFGTNEKGPHDGALAVTMHD